MGAPLIVLGTLAFVIAACGVGAPGGTSSTSAPESPDAGFERGSVEVTTQSGESVRIDAEIADDPPSRAAGLMDRAELAPDAGMVLLYDEPQVVEVWMKNTTIPLSAAWFDESGEIVWIEDLDPCESDPCLRYAAPTRVIGVLEVNRGAFERWGIAVGETLRMDPPLP